MPLELPDGWRDQLPEDIKTNGVFDDIKSIDQMAKMIVNSRQLQTKQISIPGSDASAEAKSTFYKDLQTKVPDLVYVGEGADMSTVYDRMGRPGSSSEYNLGDVPDPLKDNFSNLAGKAHELGISNKQFKGITDMIVGDYTKSADLHAGRVDELGKALDKEYGEARGEKLKTATNFAKQIGFDDTFVAAISDGEVSVDNMKALEKVMGGYKSSGPNIGDEDGAGGFTHLTPDQAELALSEIEKNKEHPYWDNSSSAHTAAVKNYVELVRAAEAGKELSETDKFREALAGRG